MTRRHTSVASHGGHHAAAGIVSSQGRGNPTEWPTAYGDAQHTSWIRNDVSISPETMSQPGIRAAVEDDARESGPARRLAEPGRRHIGCEYLHAALDDRRPFQPDFCG